VRIASSRSTVSSCPSGSSPERSTTLDVPEKLVPEPGSAVRAFDQPRDISHHDPRRVRKRHHAQPRFGRRKGIGRHLRPGRRDPRQQRGLARVRQADQADIGEEAQLQTHPALFAGLSRLRLARGPVRGRGEVGVSPPSPPAASQDEPLARRGEIGQPGPRRVIEHRGACGDRDDPVLPRAPGAPAALSVPAAGRDEPPAVAEWQQRVEVGIGHQEHVSAPAAVPPGRAAFGNEFFPAERDTAIPAVPRLDVNARQIDKHRTPRDGIKKPRARRAQGVPEALKNP
jgi:hypothetical protein